MRKLAIWQSHCRSVAQRNQSVPLYSDDNINIKYNRKDYYNTTHPCNTLFRISYSKDDNDTSIYA